MQGELRKAYIEFASQARLPSYLVLSCNKKRAPVGREDRGERKKVSKDGEWQGKRICKNRKNKEGSRVKWMYVGAVGGGGCCIEKNPLTSLLDVMYKNDVNSTQSGKVK